MKVIATSEQVIHRLLRGTFAVFLLGLSTTAAGQDSGVLLGFRFWDNSPRYATLWIYSSGTQAKVIEVPGLLVPRKSGFWRVGNYYTHITGKEIESPNGTTITDDTFEEHLWALPVGRRPTISLGPHEKSPTVFADDACVNIFRDVHFANEAFLSVEKNAGYECGVHPDGDTELDVLTWMENASPFLSFLVPRVERPSKKTLPKGRNRIHVTPLCKQTNRIGISLGVKAAG